MTIADLSALLPLLVVILTAFILLLAEVFARGDERGWAANLAVAGLLVALYTTARTVTSATSLELFSGALLVDAFGSIASGVLMTAGIIAALLSPAYLRNARCASGEYYALLLLSIAGMMVMAMAGDLFTLFLGLEVMSIAVYVLTGIRTNDLRSSEAALKYFLMGAFASAFLLFGISMLYGATGSVGLGELRRHLSAGYSAISMLGLILVFAGFAFKIAAVPFHLWAPDVYEGAPTPVSGFMAVSVKAAAFVGLLRLVISGIGPGAASGTVIVPLLSLLAYSTIIGGNLLAAMQRNIKRMLAYSSISHAGYALIGIVAAVRGEPSAGAAVLFYLTAYTFMTLGAFGVLAFLERRDGGGEAERFGAYAGIGYKFPAIGLAMSLFMIALAGMPLTGGFVGKLYLFSAALKADLLGLVIAGIVGSVISVYYYLRVVVAFYMRDIPDPGPLPEGTWSTQIALGLWIAVIGVLALGLFPNTLIQFGQAAIRSLG